LKCPRLPFPNESEINSDLLQLSKEVGIVLQALVLPIE
jgi:hypothetical protein